MHYTMHRKWQQRRHQNLQYVKGKSKRHIHFETSREYVNLNPHITRQGTTAKQHNDFMTLRIYITLLSRMVPYIHSANEVKCLVFLHIIQNVLVPKQPATSIREIRVGRNNSRYSRVSKKYPRGFSDIWHFFPNSWEFLIQILHAYNTFLSTLDYKFLFNYPQH